MKKFLVLSCLGIIAFSTSVSASNPDPAIYGENVFTDYDPEQFKPDTEKPLHPEKEYSEEWTIYEGHKEIIVNKYDITWSPDGKWIAFWQQTAGTWIVSPDGGIPRRLYYHLEEYDGYLIHRIASIQGFTPDSKELILNVGSIDEDRGTEVTLNFSGSTYTGARIQNPVSVILAVDVETGAVRTVLEEAYGGIYSSDGRYFLYKNSDFKYRTEPDYDGKQKGVMILDTVTGQTSYFPNEVITFAVNPKDGLIYYSVYDSETGIKSLMKAEFDGSNKEQVHIEKENFHGFSFSPDGDYLLLSCDTGSREGESEYGIQYHTSSITKIFVCDMKDNSMYPVFPLSPAISYESPSWSPDGSQICYKFFMLGDEVFNDTIRILEFDFERLRNNSTFVETNAPEACSLEAPYPNPFNPATTIEFSLPSQGFTELAVFNTAGQKIRELVSGDMAPGAHSVIWDGRNDQGEQVSSGVYISRLKSAKVTASRRVILLK